MHRRKKRGSLLLRLPLALFLVTVLGFLLVSLFSRFVIRPVLLTAGISEAKAIATIAISDAVNAAASASDVNYNEILQLKTDASGNLKAITTDSGKINLIKSEMTEAILKNLDVGLQKLELPLGNFISGELFSGRGPMLSFQILPIGSVETELSTLFTESGINQTKLQIILNVKAEVEILMPGSSVMSDVTTSICIAEAVIVGDVPHYYTQIGETESAGRSAAQLAADYGAEKFAGVE